MTFNPKYIGSDFDDFLREEGIFEEIEAAAIKKVVACMVEQAIADNHLSKAEVARRMGTSRTQLDRLLDPANRSITLATIVKAARVLGKKISITFEDVATPKAA
jgi:predicted XRE-type DNA-binding protein